MKRYRIYSTINNGSRSKRNILASIQHDSSFQLESLSERFSEDVAQNFMNSADQAADAVLTGIEQWLADNNNCLKSDVTLWASYSPFFNEDDILEGVVDMRGVVDSPIRNRYGEMTTTNFFPSIEFQEGSQFKISRNTILVPINVDGTLPSNVLSKLTSAGYQFMDNNN